MIKHFCTKKEIIDYLGLFRSPSGSSWFKIIQHDVEKTHKKTNNKSNSTTYYYLFSREQKIQWHKFDLSLIWGFIAGSPLILQMANTKKIKDVKILGDINFSQQQPVISVPKKTWQSLRPVEGWTLTSCTYVPGYELDRLKIAVPGWSPGQGKPLLSFPGEKWMRATNTTLAQHP